jgi:putative PIN family toxin of toxin-antitoxin system
MICYAVIDTNVLVSALLSNNNEAATVQIIGRLIAGEIIPAYSKEIVSEYREVLNRKRFKFDTETVDYLLSAIDRYGILVEPSPTGSVLPDMKDLPFYEVVMEKRDDDAYLVTGNLKHFPKKPFIVTARQMIDILDGKEIIE